jgi:hypothetical protein
VRAARERERAAVGVDDLEPFRGRVAASAGTTPVRTAGEAIDPGLARQRARVAVEERVDAAGRSGRLRERFQLAAPFVDQRAQRVGAGPEGQLGVQHRAGQAAPRGIGRGRRELQHQRVAAAAPPAQPGALHAEALVLLDDLPGDRPFVAEAFAGGDDLVALEREADRRADVGGQRGVERVQAPRRLDEQRQAPELVGEAMAPVGAGARQAAEAAHARREARRLRVDEARRLRVPRRRHRA